MESEDQRTVPVPWFATDTKEATRDSRRRRLIRREIMLLKRMAGVAPKETRTRRGAQVARLQGMGLGVTGLTLWADGSLSGAGASGNVRGAHADVTFRGYRDQEAFVTISGPEVSFSRAMVNHSIAARRDAMKFAADVNSFVARTGDG